MTTFEIVDFTLIVFCLFVNLKLNYSFSLQTSDIKGILYIKHLTGWYYDYDSNKEKIKQ